ncbi:hypothetical protein [Mycolicibacterium sp. CR10]|uniref:hypothetical protein n=1 Tax=Mycolicibacterium sp. CR10 TaxID=2562314 RepID=UPI0010BFADB3|nr:hypothetical protein [Mycolicibacterium sp. CR10]
MATTVEILARFDPSGMIGGDLRTIDGRLATDEERDEFREAFRRATMDDFEAVGRLLRERGESMLRAAAMPDRMGR